MSVSDSYKSSIFFFCHPSKVIENHFLNHFPHQLPQQMAAVLNNSYLSHVVSCMPETTTLQRLSFWLTMQLSSGVFASRKSFFFSFFFG